MLIIDAAKLLEVGRQQAEHERVKHTLRMVDEICDLPWWYLFRIQRIKMILKARS